jgi:hypothetical protein
MLVAGIGAGLGVLHAADPQPVTIAVIRGDGVLIPIVTRTGTKWSLSWPVPAKSADVPLGLDGIPKRWWGKPGPTTTWHAWQIDGSTSDVVAERPTWYLAHCQQGVGLLTSLTARPPIPPPTVQPYPKLGLASSAPLPFQRIEPLDQSAPIWKAVVDAVTLAVTKAEGQMTTVGMMRIGGGPPPHPIPKAERDKVPTRIEALYRAPVGDGRFLYYVEATKRYGMPPLPADQKSPARTPQSGCSLMTFARAWFIGGPENEPSALTIPSLTARVAACDYGDVMLMLPLAAIADSGEPVWIVQFSSWDTEAFAVMRWDPEKKDAEIPHLTHGGICGDERGW